MAQRIPLRARDGSIRAWAIVDNADYEDLAQYRWCMMVPQGYAVRNRSTAEGRGLEYMARRLLGLQRGDPRQGDHKDRNRLNNQRSNLRILPGVRQNLQNTSAHPTSTSAHRGVWWSPEREKWIARVKVSGRPHFLGYFASEEDAAAAALAGRKRLMPYSLD